MNKPIETINIEVNLYYDKWIDHPKALFLREKIEKHLKLQIEDHKNLFERLMKISLDELQTMFELEYPQEK